jgi:hypothetical protein
MRTPAVATFLLLAAAAAQEGPPRTIPEASGYERTSRAEDVVRFLRACTSLPSGDRLHLRAAGSSSQGRELLLVEVRRPAAPRPPLRALLLGNIHGGEVEGKEALQQLAREFALGEHDDVLARCEVWLLPVYNVDGNEAMGAKNRAGQNGPDLAGERANAQGLDLNRDFVKARAPETRALLGLFAAFDPHLFVDLHTTNGSYHGYHLTYAPCLSPNQDPELARLSRALLDDAQTALAAQGFASFDYGNFETRDWDGGGAPESKAGVRGWYSYDHRARYGVNYFGLRNRIGVLSEAYSYADFQTRIAATHAFVLALLRGLVAQAGEVQATIAAADRRPAGGEPLAFGFDTTFAPPETLPVLVGAVERRDGDGARPLRFVRQGDGTPEAMPVFRRFASRRQIPLPQAWAIPDPTPDVLELLQLHGIATRRLTAPQAAAAQTFAVAQKRKPKRPFQGHHELQLDGAWGEPAEVELPAGTLWIAADQPLARLCATLLEPTSEDSLSTWNFLEAATTDTYPVLRIVRR